MIHTLHVRLNRILKHQGNQKMAEFCFWTAFVDVAWTQALTRCAGFTFNTVLLIISLLNNNLRSCFYKCSNLTHDIWNVQYLFGTITICSLRCFNHGFGYFPHNLFPEKFQNHIPSKGLRYYDGKLSVSIWLGYGTQTLVQIIYKMYLRGVCVLCVRVTYKLENSEYRKLVYIINSSNQRP